MEEIYELANITNCVPRFSSLCYIGNTWEDCIGKYLQFVIIIYPSEGFLYANLKFGNL